MYNTSYAWGTVNHSEISDKKHAVFEADARTRTSTSTYGYEMAKVPFSLFPTARNAGNRPYHSSTQEKRAAYLDTNDPSLNIFSQQHLKAFILPAYLDDTGIKASRLLVLTC
jgi:hypothetical protein